jgi:hypothetical protein
VTRALSGARDAVTVYRLKTTVRRLELLVLSWDRD